MWLCGRRLAANLPLLVKVLGARRGLGLHGGPCPTRPRRPSTPPPRVQRPRRPPTHPHHFPPARWPGGHVGHGGPTSCPVLRFRDHFVAIAMNWRFGPSGIAMSRGCTCERRDEKPSAMKSRPARRVSELPSARPRRGERGEASSTCTTERFRIQRFRSRELGTRFLTHEQKRVAQLVLTMCSALESVQCVAL